MTSQPDHPPAAAQQYLSEAEEANVRSGHQPMESDCTPGEIVCTGCEDEDGWPCTTQMLLNQIDALREQHAHLLAQHEGDAQILGDHIAALGDWERASARDGQTIAGLEAQIATARAQLDAWQDNRRGATVQAAAATLAASPGPEAPEPAALEDDRLVTVWEGEPWVQRFNEQHLSPWCPGCRCLYAGPHAKDCPYLDCTEPREAE